MNPENQNTNLPPQQVSPAQTITPVPEVIQNNYQTNAETKSPEIQMNKQNMETKSPSEYKKVANLWLIVGFVIWFASNAIRQYYPSIIIMGWILFFIGYSMFIFGCINYVKAKGYHWAIGFLGMLNLIGLIILVLLPDKNKALQQNI